MYGLVNRAVKQVVIENGGDDAWLRVTDKVGYHSIDFVSNEGYPDSLTYDLIAAATAVLGVSSEVFLHELGIHYILTTARVGYGALLEAAGHDIESFLCNLPTMHARIKLIFPHLDPPEFVVTDRDTEHVTLQYFSSRDGLAPFIHGLLIGVGQRYNKALTINQTQYRSECGHDTFTTSWTEL